MSWFASIHVQAADPAAVVDAARRLSLRDCYVGSSGAGWIGVISKRAEVSAGVYAPVLAKLLSKEMKTNAMTIRVYDEESFSVSLFKEGRRIYDYPRARGWKFWRRSLNRALLNLAVTPQLASDARRILEDESKSRIAGVPRPDQASIEAALADLRKISSMTSEEKIALGRKYESGARGQARSALMENLETLCKAVGITDYDRLYSDFEDESNEGVAAGGFIHLG